MLHFCLDIFFIKRYNKRFIQFRVLTLNILFKKFFIELWMNCRLKKNSLSSLNHPVDPLDRPSKLSKSFLQIVTTASFIYSNSPLPLSTSFINDFFSNNGVVTTASFLSSKKLLTFSTYDMMDFPLTFSSKLVHSRHMLSTYYFNKNLKRFFPVRLSTLYQILHVQVWYNR